LYLHTSWKIAQLSSGRKPTGVDAIGYLKHRDDNMTQVGIENDPVDSKAIPLLLVGIPLAVFLLIRGDTTYFAFVLIGAIVAAFFIHTQGIGDARRLALLIEALLDPD
jgi:hypothetical protein